MARYIKSTDDLPAWFDLDNYRVFNDLTGKELGVELDNRACAFHALTEQAELEDAVNIMKLIEKSPVIGGGWESVLFGREDYGAHQNLIDESIISYRGADTVLVSELDVMWAGLTSRVVEWYAERAKGWTEEQAAGFVYQKVNSAWREYEPEKEKQDRAFVVVDLEARDSEIIADFELFLKKYRKKYDVSEPEGVRTVKIDTAVQKILHYRCMPYLDLTLWASLNDFKIKGSTLAGALFPDSSKGEDEIREQTKVYAEKGMTHAFLQSLSSDHMRKKLEN
jgi:hypothetical protein